MPGGDNDQSNEQFEAEADLHVQSHMQAPVGQPQTQSAADQRDQVQVAPDAKDDNVVTWEASEYIHHQKSSGWFITLILGALLLAVALYLLTHDIFSVAVLVLMAVTIGIFAARPPRTLRYSLSANGLSVDQKHYPLDDFRSFSLAQEGAIVSITFLPTKRFMVPVTVYFSPQDEDKIMQVLANNLPHEDRPPDVIDRWSSRLRF